MTGSSTPRVDAIALRLTGRAGLFCDDESLAQYNDLVREARQLERDLGMAQDALMLREGDLRNAPRPSQGTTRPGPVGDAFNFWWTGQPNHEEWPESVRQLAWTVWKASAARSPQVATVPLEEAVALAECRDPNDGRDHTDCPFCGIARDIRALAQRSHTRTTANPERRSSLEHSEVKPDGNAERRSGAVDREGSGGNGSAPRDELRAGGAERGARAASGGSDEEGLTGEGVSAPSSTAAQEDEAQIQWWRKALLAGTDPTFGPKSKLYAARINALCDLALIAIRDDAAQLSAIESRGKDG